jgi:hypothetical protein
MATEVLKNQLIEFPQFQPTPPETSKPAAGAGAARSFSTSEPVPLDRRSSMDLPQEDAIQIAAETAKTLESLKIMSEIKTGSLPSL